MRFNVSRILIGVIIASVASRFYDNFTKRLEHEDKNFHEGLIILAILLIMWKAPEN